MAAVLLLTQVMASTGCVDWYSMQTTTPPSPAPRSMQLWTGDSAVVVRYPIVRNDSLIATIGGDSARQGGVPVSLPLADVDSTKLRHVSPTRTVLAVFGGFTIFVGLVLAGCGGGCSFD